MPFTSSRPTLSHRVAVCLADSGVPALALRDIAKLLGIKIDTAYQVMLDMRRQRLLTGPQSALHLTAGGQEFAQRSRGLFPREANT